VNVHTSRRFPAANRGDGSPGELANATCALCGIELSIISLVPDGGPGSAEVRWYCRDIVSCTERWTADRARPDSQAALPGANAPDPGAESVPDEQTGPPGDPAPVAGDAQAPAEEPGPADESGLAGEPEPPGHPGPSEEPRPAKVRAGQAGGRGHRDVG
jgi:hypothetical protein